MNEPDGKDESVPHPPVSSSPAPSSAARPASTGWDVEVIADSDSRWKWGATLARRMLAADPSSTVDTADTAEPLVRVHATLLEGRSCPSPRQLADIGESADSMRRMSLAEAADRLANSQAQVVVLACIGSGVQALLHALARVWRGRESRPVVVTGYVGLVYEKTVDGLLLRAGADVVLANSAGDAERFREIFDRAGADPDTIVQTALPFLTGELYDPAGAADRPFTVTFVTQPGVPETRAERRYIMQQAVRHAQLHPEREVVIKLRARAGERSTHVEPHPYWKLLPKRDIPANLEFVHGAMGPVLDRTDLCVTVSSTAGLEAMHRGIPTAVLTDFGIRESLGNHVFLGCGAFASWPDLHDGALPKVDVRWAEHNGVRDPHPYAAAAERVGELVARRDTLPALRPTLQTSAAPLYLPDLLARNGLDADGAPLAGGLRETTFVRRAARSAARRTYEVGVRVLEPRMRRMAQL